MISTVDAAFAFEGARYITTERYGAKAANLWAMYANNLKLGSTRIPYAVALSTDTEKSYNSDHGLVSDLMSHIRWLEVKYPQYDVKAYSVRSGAPVSMPGMMDTILNVGLNESNLETFAAERETSLDVAFEAYWRFLAGYASSVMNIDAHPIEEIMRSTKVIYRGSSLQMDNERITNQILKVINQESSLNIPADRSLLFLECIKAVWRSWNSDRAVAYRKINNIPDDMGTGVLIQEMVYGHLNERSATGVAFSHNPNTGLEGLYGDYLIQAQGEDVVSGLYTPLNITQMSVDENLTDVARQLQELVETIYDHAQEPVDIEVTIQDGKLYLLQWRVAKMSRKATVRATIEASIQGKIDGVAATQKILKLMPNADVVTSTDGTTRCIARGLDEVTEGLASGLVAIGHEQAKVYMDSGEQFIFVAQNTSPDDFEYMVASNGLVTVEGGAVCHATLIARNYEKVCIPGCSDIEIADDNSGFTVNGEFIPAGTPLVINGDSGEVLV